MNDENSDKETLNSHVKRKVRKKAQFGTCEMYRAVDSRDKTMQFAIVGLLFRQQACTCIPLSRNSLFASYPQRRLCNF